MEAGDIKIEIQKLIDHQNDPDVLERGYIKINSYL